MRNISDNNAILSVVNIIEELLKTLHNSLEEAKDWFRNISMVVNPGQLQSIIIDSKIVIIILQI